MHGLGRSGAVTPCGSANGATGVTGTLRRPAARHRGRRLCRRRRHRGSRATRQHLVGVGQRVERSAPLRLPTRARQARRCARRCRSSCGACRCCSRTDPGCSRRRADRVVERRAVGPAGVAAKGRVNVVEAPVLEERMASCTILAASGGPNTLAPRGLPVPSSMLR